ncbi:MAG: flagellar motor protein [Gammaproteobacteria bacterium]|nr:flagellar motor protein [Gammaproteobacteria bacterium]
MDILSVLGLLLAVSAVLSGQYLDGGEALMLFNAPALLIVVGGTLGATMLQSPAAVFARALQISAWVLRPPELPLEAIFNDLIHWCRTARRDGLLGLEVIVETVAHPFARKAVQLLIDGNDPELIRETLMSDSVAREQRDLQAARVYEAMGGYAPTLGILGAVIGLIEVMNHLSDPALLGRGIAVAFVATVYGVAFANLVFLPMGAKLKALVRNETRMEEMITIGITAIADGENPRVVESRLQGLLG